MKVTLRFSGLFFGLFVWSTMAWAQPANDKCVDAIDILVYDNRDEAVRTDGDTRNTTDGNLDNIPACSVNFKRDDVWYRVVAPDPAPEHGWSIEFEFGLEPTDIRLVGFALYASCDATPANQPLYCTVTSMDNLLSISQCPQTVVAGETYYIRVWSAEGLDPDWQVGWGTFRIFSYLNGESSAEALWGNEPGQGDFDGGLNGWTAVGLACSGGDAANATWVWDPIGSALSGAYATGQVNLSPTYCNGAMVFNSDFLDNGGIAGNFGGGTCPANQSAELISPIIDISEFDVAGVVVQFHQSIREFNSRHFVGFSLNGGETWQEVEINTDIPVNSGHLNETIRVALPGAVGASQLQVKFRIDGNYYYWVIDDVKIVPRECTNTRVQRNFFAVAPFALVPTHMVHDYPILADILNAGACEQTNVILNHTVQSSTGNVIYDEDNFYGTLISDQLAENDLFDAFVEVPKIPATYTGTYTLTQDMEDFDPSDNTLSYTFRVGGNELALEEAFTRSITPAASNYNAGAPMSYAYGNFFWAAAEAKVNAINWGVNNPDDMAGIAVNVHLLQWTDTNGDGTSSFNERRFVGTAEYTFVGNEGDNVTIRSVLDNIDDPEAPVMMEAGKGYIAIVEYQAFSAADPQLFLLASEARNYSPTNFAFDTARAEGLTDQVFFASVLGLSPDGNLGQIDYGAQTGTFGFNIVPLVRIEVDTTFISTKDVLAAENGISVYPNPATDNIQVKLDFAKSYSNVTLRLLDQLGRVVNQRTLSQSVNQHTEIIRVSELAAGNYMLQVLTPGGQRTIPVVIVK